MPPSSHFSFNDNHSTTSATNSIISKSARRRGASAVAATALPEKKLLFTVLKAHNVALERQFYVTVTVNHQITYKTCLREPSPRLHLNGEMNQQVDENQTDTTDAASHDIKQPIHFPPVIFSYDLNASASYNYNAGGAASPASMLSSPSVTPSSPGLGSPFPSSPNRRHSRKQQQIRQIPITVTLFSSPNDEYVSSTSCNIDTNVFLDRTYLKQQQNMDIAAAAAAGSGTQHASTNSQQANGTASDQQQHSNTNTKAYQMVVLRMQLSPLNSTYIELGMTMYDESVHRRDYEHVQKLVLQNDLERIKTLFDSTSSSKSSGSIFSSSTSRRQSLLKEASSPPNHYLKDYIFENIIEGNHTLLHVACERGYTKMVQYFLQDVAPYERNLAIYDSQRIENPFQAACRNKHIPVIHYLIDSKKNYLLFDPSLILMQRDHRLYRYSRAQQKKIEKKSPTGDRNAQSTRSRGHTVVRQQPVMAALPTQLFISLDLQLLPSSQDLKITIPPLNISSDTAYFSPLHDACFRDDERILKILLQKMFHRETDPKLYESLLTECLCLASFVGAIKCVTILIQFGANVDASLSSIDDSCLEHAVPLYFACIARQTKIISRLLERGARIPYTPTREEIATVKNEGLIKKAFPLLLCLLVEGMRQDFIVELYKLYFKMQLNEDEVCDLLSVAALHCMPLFEEMIGDKSIDWTHKSRVSGLHPIHYVAEFAQESQLDTLLGHEIFSDTSTILEVKTVDEGQTPLHVAAQHGNVASIWRLREAGAGLNTVDNRGWTPIMTAIEYGCAYAAKVLCDLCEQVAGKECLWTDNDSLSTTEEEQDGEIEPSEESSAPPISPLPPKYRLFFAILTGNRSLALRSLKENLNAPTDSLEFGPALFYCCSPLDSRMQDTQSLSILHQIIARVLLHRDYSTSLSDANNSIDLLSFALKNERQDMATFLLEQSQKWNAGQSLLYLYKHMPAQFSQWSNVLLEDSTCSFTVTDNHDYTILHHIAEAKHEDALLLYQNYISHSSQSPCIVRSKETGHTPLHKLCRSGINVLPIVDRKIASVLVQLGDKPFICDEEGHTAFYYALINRRFNICEVFMTSFGIECALRAFQSGVPLAGENDPNSFVSKKSILRELLDSSHNNDALVNALIDSIEYFVFHKVDILSVGFDITQYCLQSKEILRLFMSTNDDALKKRDEDGNNPVHHLFGNGLPLSRDILELLNNGGLLCSLICQKNKYGISPLMLCFKDPSLRNCAIDIMKVASKEELRLNAKDQSGNSILHTLVKQGDALLIETMLQLCAHQVDIHQVNPRTGKNAFDMLLAEQKPSESAPPKMTRSASVIGSTPLGSSQQPLLSKQQSAAHQIAGLLLRGGIALCSDTVKRALELGFGPVLRENKSHWDISCLIKEGRFAQAQSSILAGGDVSTAEFNDNGNCAIHEAVQVKSIDLVRRLIDAGSDLNLLNSNGDTALHMAVSIGVLDILRMLARSPKCDLNIQNRSGYTPLQAVMLARPAKSFNRIVQVLVENGADILVTDGKHRSVVHLFCFENTSPDTSAFAIVCKKNRDLLSMQDGEGKTPLHYAVEYDNYDLVKKIASSKYTNLYLRDKEGNLPLDLATDYRMRKAIKDRYMQGYLLKKAPKGVVRLHKRRWFILQADVIQYYMSDEMKELKGEIPVDEILGAKQVDALSYRFEILMQQSNRKYELQAENKTSFERWMKVFELRGFM